VSAAPRLQDELGDDQMLSLRAVARDIGVAATSVHLHFADRDALVLAAMRRCHQDLMRAVDESEAFSDDPVAQLRARTILMGTWAHRHPGLYKVLHESSLNQRAGMPFKEELAERTTAVIRRCMHLGAAPEGDAAVVAFDLRAAIHGSVSMRVNQPDFPWPPLDGQVERFLTKLVGVPGPGRP
jgi:AcrR family transcriptional regulator